MAYRFFILAGLFLLSSPAGAAETSKDKSAPLYLEIQLQSLRDTFYNLPIGEGPLRVLDKERLLYQQGAYEKAVAAFHQLGPDQTAPSLPGELWDEARYLAANSYLRMGEYARAETLFLRIPEESPHYLYARYGMALSALYRYQGDQAVRYLEEVAGRVNGSDASGTLQDLAWKAQRTLSFFYLEQGRFPEALLEFSKIPPDNPYYPQALFGSGWGFARQGEWTRALVFWQELFLKFPQNPYTDEILLAIGQSYSRLSAYVKAAESYGEALRILGDRRREVTLWSDRVKEFGTQPDLERLETVEKLTGLVETGFGDRFRQYRGILQMEGLVQSLLTQLDEKQKSRPQTLRFEDRLLREQFQEFLKLSLEVRTGIWNDIFPRLVQGLSKSQERLLENSAIATVEIARNLRLANSRRSMEQAP